jgi:hypothetical protein
MTDGLARPRPGTDQIAIAPPYGWRRCARLDHTMTATPAQVVACFGPLGDHGLAVWFTGCSGRAYPLCAACWQHTSALAAASGLTVTTAAGLPGWP